jgi:tRNA pseudouridine(55) synthase
MTSSQENNLHLVYKNLGETPLERLESFRVDHQEFQDSKITYAGRLDPMAEGLLILLTNEAVNAKENFLNLSKTYEVEVLWGVGTDTQDVLGLVFETSTKNPSIDEAKKFLRESVGKFLQKYPAYSSRPVEGKPLFAWAREGKINEVEIPSHEVEVIHASFVERKTVSKENMLSEIQNKISLVRGDFRQKEIISKWQQTLKNIEVHEFVVDRVVLEVSSGFYVRQFVSDMADKLGIRALTFHIKRTKVGEFEL